MDHASAAYAKSKEAHDRFKRYCNMKDAEPSHSDKKFCKDYGKHNRATGTTTGASTGKGATRPSTATDSARPSTATEPAYPSTATDPARPSRATDSAGTPAATGSEQAARSPQAEQPSKGNLPFTGLEVWQLALAGVALVGGGLGARRLLAG